MAKRDDDQVLERFQSHLEGGSYNHHPSYDRFIVCITMNNTDCYVSECSGQTQAVSEWCNDRSVVFIAGKPNYLFW